ncbi:hypothetical protein MASR1M107_05550 [Ignavibacteriales bacterium]
MKIYNNEVNELTDEQWTTISIAYFTILADFRQRQFPPLERNFIQAFKEQFEIEINEEEFAEIKDFAENYYSESVQDKIAHDLINGYRIDY